MHTVTPFRIAAASTSELLTREELLAYAKADLRKRFKNAVAAGAVLGSLPAQLVLRLERGAFSAHALLLVSLFVLTVLAFALVQLALYPRRLREARLEVEREHRELRALLEPGAAR